MGILQTIADEQLRRDINFRVADQVKVHVRIIEGEKQRIQIFEGKVIALRRGGNRASFTVRKMSYGTGVERIFPVHSPSVAKVEVVSSGKVRRAKLYYLRDRRGKAARLKEADTTRVGTSSEIAPAAVAAPAETKA
jgi:large subunit ribosomal protein L19